MPHQFWSGSRALSRKSPVEAIWLAVRSGVRMLRRRPAFTAAAVFMLALGIGASTAIFSVVNAVLLRPLPYKEPDRLVLLWGNFTMFNIERLGAKAAEYLDYKTRTESFADVAAYTLRDVTITGDRPESILATDVSANLFPMIGAAPMMGRLIEPADVPQDSDQAAVAVLSYSFWQRRFGGDRGILGKSIALDGYPHTVIGVMPAGFQFPHQDLPGSGRVDLWRPVGFTAEQIAKRNRPYYLSVLARLRAGVSLDQARADMNGLSQWMEANLHGYLGPKKEKGGWRVTVVAMQEELAGRSRLALLTLSAAVGCLLLIACANVANLLLVRGEARQKELAIRAAVGASRLTLLRQLLVESLLLAGLGGAAGLVLARMGVSLLRWLEPGDLPRLHEINLDARVLVFSIALTVLTGLVFGLTPALRATRLDLQAALKETGASVIGARRPARMRNLLVVSEVAIAFVLLAGAGLLINSFLRLQRVHPGVDVEKVLASSLNLPGKKYGEPERQAAFFQDLLTRLAAVPGVEAASLGSFRPLSGRALNDPFAIDGRPLDPNRPNFAGWQIVTPDHFRALGISLVRGRVFSASDHLTAPRVAVINETMARTYWPNEDPLGRRITLGLPNPKNPWAMIIGIVRDVPDRSVESKPAPGWYLPYLQTCIDRPTRDMDLFVRTAVDPASFERTLRQQVLALDPDLPITEIMPMSRVVAATTAPRRFNTFLLSLFAVIAMILAAFGIYSVISYSVQQRVHEIGIRMALGAQSGDMQRMVLWQGMAPVAFGLILGVLAAVMLTRFMKTLLYGVSATDPLTYSLIAMLLLIVALLACFLPARRATKVDPIIALRSE